MTVEFELHPSLPSLSWCARARPGAAVQVKHGAGVEVRAEGFVEGAWDGELDAFDFDRAETLVGTGGRVRDGMFVFAAPFHPLERLFVARRAGETLVSNSLVFLLEEAGDALDLSHPNYFFDFVAQARAGILAPASLRMASGISVEVFRCCNLELRGDGTLHRTPKPLGPAPGCYADYFALFDRTTKAVARNAAAAGRKKTYRLVAACSRGYDSTATAALASLAGCREGVTFGHSLRPAGHPLTGITESMEDDSGADSLRALGMSVTEFERGALASLPGFAAAEFYINHPAATTDSTSRLMEETLRGSVFVSGRHGERYWGPTARCRRENFRELDDCVLSGHGLGEFRLRAGFLHFPLPYVGGLHGPAIFRITQSPEMQPWNLGTGYYDRPIARRIAEEAGVPRENFGHKKFGGVASSSRAWNVESERDFQEFLQSGVPEAIRRRLDPRPPTERIANHRKLAYIRTQYSHLPLVAPLLDGLRTDRWHKMWNSTRLYQFHWGLSKLRVRYT